MKFRFSTILGAIGTFAAATWAFRQFKESRYSLDGRVVLITGGSRGLGLLLAREYARRGAKLVLVARDAAALDRACSELREGGAQVFGARCDLVDEQSVFAMVAQAIERFGRIDIVVNDAGRIEVGPLASMTVTDFRDAMETNFWGAFNVINATLPHLPEGEGRIVNISSVGGLVSVPHLLAYSASKFALTGFSLGMRMALEERGISVVTVCPGLMRTGSPINALFKGDQSAEYGWFSTAASLPFVSMSGERAARAIVRASRRGDVRLVLGLPAKLATLASALFPVTTVRAATAVTRLLPQSSDTGMRRGDDVDKPPASFLSRLGDRAAEKNNELNATRDLSPDSA